MTFTELLFAAAHSETTPLVLTDGTATAYDLVSLATCYQKDQFMDKVQHNHRLNRIGGNMLDLQSWPLSFWIIKSYKQKDSYISQIKKGLEQHKVNAKKS